jgi:hypothetical protein
LSTDWSSGSSRHSATLPGNHLRGRLVQPEADEDGSFVDPRYSPSPNSSGTSRSSQRPGASARAMPDNSASTPPLSRASRADPGANPRLAWSWSLTKNDSVVRSHSPEWPSRSPCLAASCPLGPACASESREPSPSTPRSGATEPGRELDPSTHSSPARRGTWRPTSLGATPSAPGRGLFSSLSVRRSALRSEQSSPREAFATRQGLSDFRVYWRVVVSSLVILQAAS